MAGDGIISFKNELLDRDAVISRIESGDYLVIAGDSKLLESLPSGNWIAGTIPYFMSEEGGCVDQQKIYVNSILGANPNNPPRITLYDAKTIPRVAQEAPQHGFTILILPASSEVHLSYAQGAPDFPNMFFSPIVGWISGVHLNELGEINPKVGFGPASGMLSDSQAVAMHIPLTDAQVADIQIVNLFKKGRGAAIHFPKSGFHVNECKIDGVDWKFADYIREYDIDTRLPLVADYSGVMVNVSVQEVLDSQVNLYAPVFEALEYHFAEPISDYVTEFDQALSSSSNSDKVAFSCNCILNYLYSDLEGKQTGRFTGPMTFGEVAYQLLNQTMVYLTLDSV